MSFHTIRMFPVAMLACVAPLEVQAQTPPDCNNSICTARVASVSPVVDGCGDHATPGRFKVILSSTNPNVDRSSFKTGIFMDVGKDRSHGSAAKFTNFEWRGGSRTNWVDVLPGGFGNITFYGGIVGENIIEVRPKEGAHIWSNRNASNPNQGPGQMVIPVINVQRSTGNRNYANQGSAYFLFMGGKGCARVGPGGGRLGGNQ